MVQKNESSRFLDCSSNNWFRIWQKINLQQSRCSYFPAPLPDIPYYFGREDCPRSPHATEEDVFLFPDAKAGWKDTKKWFKENLALTVRETVALLGTESFSSISNQPKLHTKTFVIHVGAHVLGKAHADASGFVSRWTFSYKCFKFRIFSQFCN